MQHSVFRAAGPSDTLLSYVMFTSPDPLQASARNAVLTLVVSNPGRRVVAVKDLVVTLPVGTTAKTLTADATGVQTEPAPGWQATSAGGSITLTPGGAGEVGGAGLTFTFAAITVNAEPGLCAITVLETASSGGEPADVRTAIIPVPKFPPQFHVGDLQASPLDVPSGGATTLMWRGSGPPAAYTLQYQPADAGPPVSEAVGSTGPYRAANLTRAGQVTFTLLAQVAVPGMDQLLTVERQASISVETASARLHARPLTVGVNGLVRLAWQTSNAGSVELAVAPPAPGPAGTSGMDDRGGPVEREGVRYFVIAQTTSFTITATDASGNEVQDQRTVHVDPSIVPNTAGYVVTGTPGAPGTDSEVPRGAGGPAFQGGEAVLHATLPPVGTSAARVIPITVRGGPGGRGGQGGESNGPFGSLTWGPGGPGGNGGIASVDVQFSASAGPPAQYIVTVAGGAPGQGGRGGFSGMQTGPAGNPGAALPIRFRDAD
jgi:hypothetical protein